MESLETTASFRDDLFDFPSDISDDDDDNLNHHNNLVLSPNRRVGHRGFSLLPCPSHLSSEYVEEEELEWISNKDAFPMVESFADIMPNHPSISTSNDNISGSNIGLSGHHLSPVSVLENSSSSTTTATISTNSGGSISANMISLPGIFKVPGKARSKQCRKRRRVLPGEQFVCWEKVKPYRGVHSAKTSSVPGRKCLHCGTEKTPQWRAGPNGPKTLCNACGVRYKSGRLVPEYRPARSPTFSTELHSNSHRKVIEMRRQKLMCGELSEVEPGLRIGYLGVL